MKTQFTERSDVNCLSEFDPALILLSLVGAIDINEFIENRFVRYSALSVKLVLDLIRALDT